MPTTPFVARPGILARLLKLRDRDRLGAAVAARRSRRIGQGRHRARVRPPAQLPRPGSLPRRCALRKLRQGCELPAPGHPLDGPAPATLSDADIRELMEQKLAQPFARGAESATAQVNIGDPENPGR